MPETDTPGSAATALLEAMATRARVEGSLVKVDDFLNHAVDPMLLDSIGRAIADRYREETVDLVLTAEASGIPPALATALHLRVPMIYAKKYPRSTAERPSFVREVVSPTKGAEYRIEVTQRLLPPNSRVLVVDDFLSGGRTAGALGEIVTEAGATVVSMVFVVEKVFTEGRQRLEADGWRIESVVKVVDIEPELVVTAGWE